MIFTTANTHFIGHFSRLVSPKVSLKGLLETMKELGQEAALYTLGKYCCLPVGGHQGT